MTNEGIPELQTILRNFAVDRDWEQFHNPKNLILALVGEVGELAEIFQWLSPDEASGIMSDRAKGRHVEEELADVLAYVLRLSDVLGVDLASALFRKIKLNEAKYPIAMARGTSKKYTEFAEPPTPEVIAIDWTGRTKGERGTLWAAGAADGKLVSLENGRTRQETINELVALKNRTPDGFVVGFDFAFSFPAWFVQDLGCTSVHELWAAVERDGEDWLANCDPPFWGKKGRTRPKSDRPQFRLAELNLMKRNIRPKSVFQVNGGGSVGTGSIRGMPYLRQLHDAGFSIWPFDPPSKWTVVEIYLRADSSYSL